MFTKPITFLILIGIFAGLLVYLGLGYTLFHSFRVISVKKQKNFEVKNVNEQLLAENRMNALAKLIFTYRDIIAQHRELNEKRAHAFKCALIGCVVTIISAVVYYTIK